MQFLQFLLNKLENPHIVLLKTWQIAHLIFLSSTCVMAIFKNFRISRQQQTSIIYIMISIPSVFPIWIYIFVYSPYHHIYKNNFLFFSENQSCWSMCSLSEQQLINYHCACMLTHLSFCLHLKKIQLLIGLIMRHVLRNYN